MNTKLGVIFAVIGVFSRFFVVFVWIVAPASARDTGQWKNEDAAIRKWFESLTVPDDPTISCCGSADAYLADDFEVKGDQYVAIVTDTRPDGPLRRMHIPPGTRILIPNNLINRAKGNPTGHGWVFIIDNTVFCYIPPEQV